MAPETFSPIIILLMFKTKVFIFIYLKAKLDECRKQSKRGNFKLTDLLRLPYQRVLKYHLLFNELLKQTDVDHTAKDLIKQTRDSMCELGNYLNECQRDKENLSHIEQLLKHLPNAVDLNSLNRNSLSSSQLVYSSGSGFSFNLLKDFGHYIKDDKFRHKSVKYFFFLIDYFIKIGCIIPN